MDEQTQQPRTAAATAAARRRAEERRAEWLRARGWECIPPDGVEQLTAVVRPAGGSLPDETRRSRVAIVARVGNGAGRPRANLDGFGDREVAAFFVPEQLPVAAPAEPYTNDRMAALAESIAACGFRPAGAWTVGVDPHGRYAAVPVKRTHGAR